jgi:hypothetical protein
MLVYWPFAKAAERQRLAGSALAPTSTVVVTGGTELKQEKQQ